MTQFALAEALGVDDRTVRRVEAGAYVPPEKYLRRWLTWLRTTEGGDAAVVEVVQLYEHARWSIACNWWPPEWGTLDDTDHPLEQGEDPMDRRTLLGVAPVFAGATMLPAGAPNPADYAHSSHVTRRAYSHLPANLLQPRVASELRVLDFELARARGDRLQALLVPYGELHLLAAWIARWDKETTEGTSAASHTHKAAAAARQAGDQDLLAHALAMYSLLARLDGPTAEGVQAAEQAVKLAPRSRAASSSFTHIIAAEANGEAGNEHAAREHIEAAKNAVDRVGSGSIWRGTGVWGLHRLRGYEGYTLRLVGRHEEAYELLHGHLGEYAGSPKYRAVHVADLADTLLGMGDLDGAAHWGKVAFADAVEGQSGHVLRRLRKLHARMEGQASAGARELGTLLYA